MQKNLWGFRENTAFQRSKHGHISPDLQASNAIIYLWTGYESDSKFTVSRDVKFEPTRSVEYFIIPNTKIFQVEILMANISIKR